MILDIDKLGKFREFQVGSNVDSPFKNIDDCLRNFIERGYHDIDFVDCRRVLGDNIITVYIKSKNGHSNNSYFGFEMVLDVYNGKYRIEYDLYRLGSDLYNRYNKLLRMYKIVKLTI